MKRLMTLIAAAAVLVTIAITTGMTFIGSFPWPDGIH